MHILIVEDDEQLGDGIRAGLKQHGHSVTWLQNGQDAINAIKVEHFDLLLLDLGLPGADGLEVLKRVRANGKDLPVMILTARDAVDDRVAGLDAGADDYMTKPFDLDELCARIRARIRRSHGRADATISYRNLNIDPAAHKVSQNGETVNLSRREFFLLLKLVDNQGKVLSRDQLTQSLYGWEDEVDSNALEVHICNIRKKIGADCIRTIRGVGYMIEKQPKESV